MKLGTRMMLSCITGFGLGTVNMGFTVLIDDPQLGIIACLIGAFLSLAITIEMYATLKGK